MSLPKSPQPQRDVRPVQWQNNCTDVMNALKQSPPAADDPRNPTCIATGPMDEQAKESVRGSRAAREANTAQSAAPWPDWCLEPEHMDGQWWYFRLQACRAWTAKLTILDKSQVPIGTLSFAVAEYVWTDGAYGPSVHSQMSIMPFGPTGAGLQPNMTINTSLGCVWTCTVHNKFVDLPVILLDNQERDGYITLAPPAGGQAATEANHFFNVSGPTIYPSGNYASYSPDIRCDDQMVGIAGPGCAFAGYVHPTLVFHYDDPLHASEALHIGWAIASGLPSRLQRLVNTSLSSNNGDRACPSGPSYPRPPAHPVIGEWECDEYPFRSSEQGAWTQAPPPATAQARTFDWCQLTWPNTIVITTNPQQPPIGSAGYSRCNIPRTDNQAGGQHLRNFYGSNRILPGEWFDVWAQ